MGIAVVTDNCRDCLFTDCVTVCPTNCFYTDGRMMFVHPEECILCGACIPECPVEAIYDDGDLPADLVHWQELNRERCESGELENVVEKREPLPSAAGRKAALGF